MAEQSVLPAQKIWIEDIIQRRENSSDFCWALKNFHPTVFKYHTTETSEEVKETVLNSVRVQYIIKQIADENGESHKALEAKAREILDEMGHTLRMHTIRGFGYILSKFMRQLFTGIYVNRDGIEKVRAVAREHPVVYMPTHRSYVDFQLLSYVCFTYGLPIPVIAAGLDFIGMKGMNGIMRNAGAFFIRRSFGNDKLYWNIFSEYIQTHVRNGNPPLEFFVEGTRSRTGKSLVPKLGFLSSMVEPFFKSELTDIAIIPITINYDRTLEEKLYSYELLGVPKPKESTKGLFKARQILKECFGIINFSVADPILLSEFCKDKMCQRIPHLGPRYLFTLTPEEQNLCKLLAYRVVREHQNFKVVSPFPLIASLMLYHLHQGEMSVPITRVIKELKWLKDIYTHLGGAVYWREGESIEHIFIESVNVHKSAVEIRLDPETSLSCLQPVPVPINESTEKLINLKGHNLNEVTISRAVPIILLSHYTNQMIHVILRPALIAVILKYNNSKCEYEELFKTYCFLEKLLSSDFIFECDESRKAFATALSSLETLGAITDQEGIISVSSSSDKLIIYLTQLMDPFLITYKVVSQVIKYLNTSLETFLISDVIRKSQACIEQLLLKNQILHFTSLSLDTLNNAIVSFLQLKLIQKYKDAITVGEEINHVINGIDRITWLPASTIMTQLCSISSAKL